MFEFWLCLSFIMLVLNGVDRQLGYEGNENTKIVSTYN